MHLDFGLHLLRELGAKTDGVDGAIFNALTAGDAVRDIDFTTIVGGDGFVGLELLDRAQAKASAAAAVADGGRIAFA